MFREIYLMLFVGCTLACIAPAQAVQEELPAAARPARVKGHKSAALWTAESLGPMELVTGAPYSAVKTIEGVRSTPDGKRIPQVKPPFRIYRDSAGRVRNELMPVPGVRSMGASTAIEIDDPIEGARYALDPAAGVAHRIKVPVRPPVDSSFEKVSPRLVSGPKQPRIQHENLGSKEIAGLVADGMRTTVTWPAGSVGNEKPRVIVSEKWVARDLKLVVLWRSSDPESSINESLTGIERKEPEASLFRVPSSYQIVDDELPSQGAGRTQPPTRVLR